MKKNFLLFVLTFIMMLSLGAVSYADDTGSYIPDGWNAERTMYLVDETPVTGVFMVPDEGYFMFDDSGYVMDGYEFVDSSLYCFNRTSPAELFTGVHEKKYYENGVLASGTFDGKKYIDGVLFSGISDGKRYSEGVLFTGLYDGRYYRNGELGTGTYGGKYYKNGNAFTGFVKPYYYKAGVKYKPSKAGAYLIGNYHYYISTSGKVYYPSKSGIHKMANGKTYYIYSSGHVKKFKKGVNKIGKKSYYFSSAYNIVNPGSCFKKIGSYTYRFAKDASLVSGFHTYNDHKYYMSKSTFKRFEDGIKTVSGQKYKFSKTGKIATKQWYKKDGKKKYYFGKSGAAYKNCAKYIGKYKYYFNSKSVLQTNLIKYKGFSWVAKKSLQAKVNRKTNTVTIYAKDGKKGYTIPVTVFLCTVGTYDRPTDKGTYRTGAIYRWKKLGGKTKTQDNGDPCWGQYVTHIYGAVYFHSVTFEKKNNHTLFTGAYNWLGNAGSHGCVRLKCGDAYTMYRLAARQRLSVKIYDGSSPGAFGKPKLKKISTNYDPTDPNIRK